LSYLKRLFFRANFFCRYQFSRFLEDSAFWFSNTSRKVFFIATSSLFAPFFKKVVLVVRSKSRVDGEEAKRDQGICHEPTNPIFRSFVDHTSVITAINIVPPTVFVWIQMQFRANDKYNFLKKWRK
jgi:hypothetical protein